MDEVLRDQLEIELVNDSSSRGDIEDQLAVGSNKLDRELPHLPEGMPLLGVLTDNNSTSSTKMLGVGFCNLVQPGRTDRGELNSMEKIGDEHMMADSNGSNESIDIRDKSMVSLMQRKLHEKSPTSSPCSIFRVHKRLRMPNEKLANLVVGAITPLSMVAKIKPQDLRLANLDVCGVWTSRQRQHQFDIATELNKTEYMHLLCLIKIWLVEILLC
ncbi:hypothetical protein CJ030_MR4G020981 [Morella rubra]|uniref:Uncharacterized protein n=1 Tax=Morella rubra TaxID=262757 RepID=A0A6A1W3F9_9ROSI|nr:hypothetical protein CJ030_MR4G020981 [Morella rubra]